MEFLKIILTVCQLFSYIVCLYVIKVFKMKFLTFIILSVLYHLTAMSQITRGAEEHELYIVSGWYWDDYNYDAIFHSSDNGEHINLQYSCVTANIAGQMRLRNPIGDASNGVIYNYGYYELWISNDFGVSWDYIDTAIVGNFTTGCQPGEIYRYASDSEGSLYRSSDFGSTFNYIRDSIKFFIDVGSEVGEIYGITGYTNYSPVILYSNN